MKLSELARIIGAELINGADAEVGSREILGVATIEGASARHVTFLTNPRWAPKLSATKAAAVIVGARLPGVDTAQLVHGNPYAAMAKASQQFYERKHAFNGQSELAFVHPSAKVAESATLYPFAFIDEGAVVGEDAIVYPHAYVGMGAKIGARTVLYPAVVVMDGCSIGDDGLVHGGAVIGADGFGFAPTREGIEKIPQIGAAHIGDDCEVGSNTTIDRGAFEDTTLARGCKLDSHVQIGHGSQLGEYGMMCGMSGLAGSVKVGKRYIAAGYAGVAPGLEIGDGVVLGAKTGLLQSISEKGEYLGMPAVPAGEWRRQMIALTKLPDLLKTVRKLEERIKELESSSPSS